jgi:glycosyltransferase involved in cell wall biosynthesis
MSKISAVIISKNSENNIADCIDSLSFCNEIVVIDNDSNDRTKDIAKKMNAKVFSISSDDFSKLRNYGLRKSTGDWILYVDSDERITDMLGENIKSQSASWRTNLKYKNVSAFRIKRKNYYLGVAKRNEWPHVEYLERLFVRDKLRGWHGKIHESPKYEGNLGELEGFLLHYTHTDLKSMVEKTIEWSKIEADLRFNINHPKVTWWRFLRVMLSAFVDSYLRQKGWKVGTFGLIESIYQSFSMFLTYARLWENQNFKHLKNGNQ